MRKALFLLACVALLLTCGCAGGRVPKAFRPEERLSAWNDADWQVVLSEVVDDRGFVRHARIKGNTRGVRDALFRYVGQIGAASPESRPELFASDADKLAYYINAYNALCMYGVYKRGYPANVAYGTVPPGGLFFTDQFRVGGKGTTLNGLERENVLDRSGRDPRVHFALNCMSYSCPPLRAEPYAGPQLEAQLDDQGRIYLSDARAVRARNDGTVELNNIFTDYYRDDFVDAARKRTGDPKAGLLDGVRPYAAEDSPVHKATGVKGMGYGWSLNTPPKRSRRQAPTSAPAPAAGRAGSSLNAGLAWPL